MISLIVFSKNRPLQLDLCLTSVSNNFQANLLVTVIYDCDPEYEFAYETLKSEHPHVNFWKQGKSLFRDILNRLRTSDACYTCFLTDDCFLFQKSSPLCNTTLDVLFENHLISCYSLRLGENTTHREFQNRFVEQESILSIPDSCRRNHRGMVKYDRTLFLYGGYWNYPLSVDGHIYRSADILDFVEELCFLEPLKKWQQTPNAFEAALQRYIVYIGPFALCGQSSCVVNSPNNRVQNTMQNKNGINEPISCQKMLDYYNKGKRIIPWKINMPKVICPHMEINLLEALS